MLHIGTLARPPPLLKETDSHTILGGQHSYQEQRRVGVFVGILKEVLNHRA